MSGLLSWGVDARLVRSTLAGNKNAFGRLVERHLPIVEAIALSCTRNWADAEDVSQEAFLKAYHSLDTLHERAKFGPWVASIARNAGLRMAARNARTEPLTEAHAATVPGKFPDPAQIELHQILRAHVLTLPEDQREVVLLHYYSGQSLREVASTLGISRDAAAKRLQRGREALSADVSRTLGGAAQTSRHNRARAKRLAAGAVAAVAAWESSAAPAALAATTIFATVLKPTVVASAITATAFVGFLTYLATNARPVAGVTPAPPVESAEAAPAVKPSAAKETSALAAPNEAKPSRETTGPGSLSITVTNDKGAPAQGASVVVEFIDWPAFTYPPSEVVRKEQAADETGLARFTNLPLGLYGMVATQGTTMWGDFIVLSNAARHADSAMQLRMGHSLDGIVLNGDGVPVPRAAVYPHSSPWMQNVPWGVFASLRMISDENGRIHHDCLPRLPLRFCIVADGYAPTLTGQLALDKGPSQLVVQKGGSFSGTVVDSATGSPLSGIALAINGEMAVEPQQAESNDKGEFSSSLLPPGTYQVALKEEGYTYDGPVTVDVSEGGVTTGIQVKLHTGGMVSGTVRNAETGEGVANATVTAHAEGQPPRSSAPTDASGAYVIFGLGRASYSVGANAEGYFGSAERDGISAAPGEEVENIDLTLTRGFLIRGRVLENDGRGATAAHIHRVSEDGQRMQSNIARTDGENGMFQILLPRTSEPIWLKAYSQYGSSEEYGPIEVTDVSAVDVVLRAGIPRTAGIEGSVVNANGTPLPYADVWAFMQGDAYLNFMTSNAIWADQSGNFAFSNLHPGVYRVFAGLEQQGRGASEATIDISDGHIEHSVVLSFGKTSSLSIVGTVTDSDRKPVAGAEITVEAPSYGQFMTGADGAFTIARPLEGPYQLRIAHPSYTTLYLDALAEGENTVAAVLQKRASLEGHVVDADSGKPIPRFALTHEVVNRRTTRTGPRTFTDPDGHFALPRTESGLTVLHVTAEGYQSESLELDIAPASKKTGVEVRLRPGGTVTGTVVTAEGEPVPDADVVADAPLGAEPRQVQNTRTNARGEFSITGLPEEEINVVVQHYALAGASARVVPDRTNPTAITITLPKTQQLSIHVTVNGEPASGAFVTAQQPGGVSSAAAGAVTEAAGIAKLKGVIEGPCRIEAHVRVGSSLTKVIATADVSIDFAGSDTVIPMNLQTGPGAIAGTISANGQPVGGELIVARCGAAQFITYSQADGTYRLDGIPAGDIPVASGPTPDELEARDTVIVEEGRVTTCDISN